MALLSIVEIEPQHFDVRKAFLVGLPPRTENVHQAIAGHLGSHPVHTQLVVLGQEHSHRRHYRFGGKVMVGGVDFDPVFARTGVIADRDNCLGIYREA